MEELFEELEGLKKAIDEAMEAAVAGYRCDVPLTREAMVYATEGGKRLRGAIVLSTYKRLGGDGDAMPFALAIEMIQAYSLVHDDLPCMDDAEMRRGRPACHRKFGEAMGVLAGDALLTLAFETAASSDLPPYRIVEGIRALACGAGAAGMVGGQVLDLEPHATQCPDGDRSLERRLNLDLGPHATQCGAGAGTASEHDLSSRLSESDTCRRVSEDDSVERTTISPLAARGPSACPPSGPSESYETDSADRVRLMYRLKTGRLFETAARLGAILAGAPAVTVERAAEAGMCFGFAYQIVDDIEDSAQGGAEDQKDTLPKRISLERAREEAIAGFQRCKQLAGPGWLLARLADYYLAMKLGVSPPGGFCRPC